MRIFPEFVLNANKPLAMPLAVYPGIQLTSWSVRDVVTNPNAQHDVVAALHGRYNTPVVFTAMDLSVEAEAFGCQVHMSANEVPTAATPIVSRLDQAQALKVPAPSDKRTRVYLETVAMLRSFPDHPFVFGSCIGPFSLAGRLVGLSEACQLTLTEPELMHTLLEKCTAFLTGYVQAFKAAGADGVIIAEPAAGLLSPSGFSMFAAAYLNRIIAGSDDDRFSTILHCCSAKVVHLSAALKTAARIFHFGAPMDMGAALEKVPPDIVLCGNLDPVRIFLQATPDEVGVKTAALVETTRRFRNFVISSGCDVPPATPLANLDAFYATVQRA